MPALRPISQTAAVQILDAASVEAGQQPLLTNSAMAGVIKAYATLIQSDVLGGARAGRNPVERITSQGVPALKGKLLAEGQSVANTNMKLSCLRTLPG